MGEGTGARISPHRKVAAKRGTNPTRSIGEICEIYINGVGWLTKKEMI